MTRQTGSQTHQSPDQYTEAGSGDCGQRQREDRVRELRHAPIIEGDDVLE